jgi:hypothetical protein
MNTLEVVHRVGVITLIALGAIFALGWLYVMSVIGSGIVDGFRRRREQNRDEGHVSRLLDTIKSSDFEASARWTVAKKVARWLFIDVAAAIVVGVVFAVLESALR